MHLYLMFLLMVAFVVVVIYLAKVAVLQFERQVDADVFKVKDSYLEIIQKKDALAADKMRLKEEMEKMFNAYDLMRALTQSMDISDAFRVFKEHVNSQVVLRDCQYLEQYTESTGAPGYEGYQFFPLKAKRLELGVLVYQGLNPADSGTFAILAHQFALAIRRIKLYRALEEMAITDELTHLHTRRYMMERFTEEFGRSSSKGLSFALLMIDVDLFKNVNDQHGHLAGDQVLREVARMIKQQTREIDIIGRYGGEEFCGFLPDTDKTGALMAAERIRAAVSNGSIRAYDALLKVSVSIGVAVFPDDGHQMDELLDKADWALYRAKRLGRGRVVGFSVYDPHT